MLAHPAMKRTAVAAKFETRQHWPARAVRADSQIFFADYKK